jgi:hypothetical protein
MPTSRGAQLKKFALASLSILIVCVLTYLVAEGIYAIVLWKDMDGSVTYKVYRLVSEGWATRQDENLPAILQTADRSRIEALLPELAKAGIGLGNTPYKELKKDRAAINTRTADGCLVQKPNLQKTLVHVRSNEFNPFDPPSLFFDKDTVLSNPVRSFISRYGFREATLTTNSFGERTTVPEVSFAQKILVAGDSVANGSMIGDDETIASQLQEQDGTRQYINLGVNESAASDTICRLEAAARRYPGQIEKLIYVYCENDFDPDLPYGKPDQVLAWLSEFKQRERIGAVTIVFAPSFYNIIPHLTRFKGYIGKRRPTYSIEAHQLSEGAKLAGFRFVSIADLAMAEARKYETDFAVFALFVDHNHLSRYGTSRLVEKLQEQ